MPFAFLTIQGVFISALVFLLLSIDMISFQKNNQELYFKYLWKVCTILFELVFAIELTITLIFWVVLYPLFDDFTDRSGFFIFNVLAHGAILIILWIENILSSVTFKNQHWYILVVYCVLYSILNAIVVLEIGEPIYPIITWTDLMSYVWILASTVVSLIHFFIGCWYFT